MIFLTTFLTSDSISHCQTTIVFHPNCASSDNFLRSRATFAWNFACQYDLFDFGVVVRGQPLCRCQKQPWTNTATLLRLKTMSGLPGRSPQFVENPTRRARSADCSIRSGPVACRLTAPMIRDRSVLEGGGRFGSPGILHPPLLPPQPALRGQQHIPRPEAPRRRSISLMLASQDRACLARESQTNRGSLGAEPPPSESVDASALDG